MAAVDHERTGRYGQLRAGRDVGLGERADRAEVLRTERIGRAEHGGDRDASPLPLGDQRLHRLRAEQLADGGVEFRRSGIACGDALELRVGELLRLAEPGPHAAPLSRRQHADPDESVAARERRIDLLVAGAAAPQLAGPLLADRGLAFGAERRIQALQDRLEPGEVDVVADAATQSVVVGDERGPRRLDRDGRGRDAVRRQHRPTRRRPGSGQRRRHRVQDRIICLPRRVRPRGAEVGDLDRDQMREPLRELGAGRAERRGAPRAPAVDQDVGFTGQLDEASPGARVAPGPAPRPACWRCSTRTRFRHRRPTVWRPGPRPRRAARPSARRRRDRRVTGQRRRSPRHRRREPEPTPRTDTCQA